MDKVKFIKMRIADLGSFFSDVFEVVISFDNDRHHSVALKKGTSRDEVVCSLRMFAEQIDRDKTSVSGESNAK